MRTHTRTVFPARPFTVRKNTAEETMVTVRCRRYLIVLLSLAAEHIAVVQEIIRLKTKRAKTIEWSRANPSGVPNRDKPTQIASIKSEKMVQVEWKIFLTTFFIKQLRFKISRRYDTTQNDIFQQFVKDFSICSFLNYQSGVSTYEKESFASYSLLSVLRATSLRFLYKNLVREYRSIHIWLVPSFCSSSKIS